MLYKAYKKNRLLIFLCLTTFIGYGTSLHAECVKLPNTSMTVIFNNKSDREILVRAIGRDYAAVPFSPSILTTLSPPKPGESTSRTYTSNYICAGENGFGAYVAATGGMPVYFNGQWVTKYDQGGSKLINPAFNEMPPSGYYFNTNYINATSSNPQLVIEFIKKK